MIFPGFSVVFPCSPIVLPLGAGTGPEGKPGFPEE